MILVIQNSTRLNDLVDKNWLKSLILYKEGVNKTFLKGYNLSGRRSSKTVEKNKNFQVLDIKSIF